MAATAPDEWPTMTCTPEPYIRRATAHPRRSCGTHCRSTHAEVVPHERDPLRLTGDVWVWHGLYGTTGSRGADYDRGWRCRTCIRHSTPCFRSWRPSQPYQSASSTRPAQPLPGTTTTESLGPLVAPTCHKVSSWNHTPVYGSYAATNLVWAAACKTGRTPRTRSAQHETTTWPRNGRTFHRVITSRISVYLAFIWPSKHKQEGQRACEPCCGCPHNSPTPPLPAMVPSAIHSPPYVLGYAYAGPATSTSSASQGAQCSAHQP